MRRPWSMRSRHARSPALVSTCMRRSRKSRPHCSRWKTSCCCLTSAALRARREWRWACERWKIFVSSSKAPRSGIAWCDPRRTGAVFGAGAARSRSTPSPRAPRITLPKSSSFSPSCCSISSGFERPRSSRCCAESEPGRSQPRSSRPHASGPGDLVSALSIAEQNAAMRRRRQIEAERGYEQLGGPSPR